MPITPLQAAALIAYLLSWLAFAIAAVLGMYVRRQQPSAAAGTIQLPVIAGTLLQWAAFVSIMFTLPAGPLRPGPFESVAGLVLAPLAVALFVWAQQFSAPRGTAEVLVTSGAYRWLRHPIYLAFLLMLLDGRPHPPSVGPSWLGHSVGTWDGDTLVVDAIGFHDRGWLNFDGQPHSDKLHVTERIRRPDLGHLEIEITLDDQGAFRKTWTGTKYATLAPDVELQEYVCSENNKDAAHLVGK